MEECVKEEEVKTSGTEGNTSILSIDGGRRRVKDGEKQQSEMDYGKSRRGWCTEINRISDFKWSMLSLLPR